MLTGVYKKVLYEIVGRYTSIKSHSRNSNNLLNETVLVNYVCRNASETAILEVFQVVDN